jgi:hypothetical protein
MNSYKIYSPRKFVCLYYVRVKLPIQIFINVGFVVPCIFKYSNKTPNQMQQSVVKFIA